MGGCVALDAIAVVLDNVSPFSASAGVGALQLIANPRSSFTLDATHLRWTSGRQQADIALSEIDHLRFDTRLDLSVRLSVVRPSGIRIRVPYPATPPHDQFVPLALQAGLTTRRHHFSLIG